MDSPLVPALPVSTLMDDIEIERMIAAGPPSSAEEYLLRVRYEASKIPGLMLSDVNPRDFDNRQTTYMPKTHEVVECCPCCLPSKRWENKLVAEFMRLRRMIEEVCAPNATHPPPDPPVALPPIEDTKGWRTLWFGIPQRQGSTGEERRRTVDGTEPAGSGAPSTTELASLDCAAPAGADPTTMPPSAIENLAEEYESGGEEQQERPRKVLVCDDRPAKRVVIGMPAYASILTALDHVSSLTLLERHVHRVCGCLHRVPYAYAQWMFGLLARVELPLDLDTASNLRVLLKHCCRLRASCCVRGDDGEDHHCHTGAHPDLPSLNVIISLLHRVFGQLE